MFKDLFLQILIILFPVLIFGSLVFNKKIITQLNLNQRYIIGLFGGIASILCMVFPVILAGDLIWDLRFVPLLLSILYGGYRAGLITCLFLLVGRLIIGGDATIFAFAFFPLHLILPMLFCRGFYRFSPVRRFIICLLSAFASYMIVMLNLATYLMVKTNTVLLIKYDSLYYLFIGVLAVLTTGIAVLLIESLIENIQMRRQLVESNKKLEESEQRYKSIVEFHPDLISTMDIHSNIIDINKSAEYMTGYSREELLSFTRKEMLFPEDYDHAYEMFSKAASGKPQRYQARVRKKNGEISTYDMTNIPIVVHNETVGVYGISKDVTEYNKMWEQLEISERRYRELVENSLDAVGIIQNNCWVYINKAGKRMFNVLNEREIIGQSIYTFLDPEFHECYEKRIIKTNKKEEGVEISEQKWHTLCGKVIHTESICIPTSFNEKEAVQVIIRDICDRKQAEKLMIQSEKLSIAGQLAAGIAHEIRNPLTAIKGFLQLMEKGFDPKSDYFKIIASELNRIELILSELLMLAKPQDIAYKITNVNNVISHVTTLLNTQAIMHNVQIVRRLFENELYIRCDENQIKQVFINFIKNAIDSMPSGGDLIIELCYEADQISIRFIDEGIGMSQEKLTRIGQPFYSTKEKGTGLGLMVSYKIIENHNGKIKVESTEGKGTTFTVILPVVQIKQNESQMDMVKI